MNPCHCVNKNCIHFYARTIHGHTDFMCDARKGHKIREYDLGSGRLIKIERLKNCPIETLK